MNLLRKPTSIFLILPVIIFMTTSLIFSTSIRNTIFYFALAISLPFIFSQKVALKKLVCDPLFLSLIALLGWISISSTWGDPTLLAKAFKYSFYIIIYYIGLYCYSHRASMTAFMRNLIAAYCAATLLCTLGWVGIEVFQLYQGEASYVFSSRRWNHILYEFQVGNPIRTSSYFFLAAIFVLIEFKDAQLNRKYVALTMLFVVWVTLGLAGQSRAPLIALLLCIAILIAYYLRNYIKHINYKLLAVITISALLAIILIYKGIGIRSDTPFHRLQIWASALEQIKSNFWFGLGYGSSEGLLFSEGSIIASYSHNFIIELLRISGVIGGSLYFLFSLLIGMNYYKSGSFPPVSLALWFLFGFTCMLASGDIILDRPSSDWLLFWTPIILLAIDSSIKRQRL